MRQTEQRGFSMIELVVVMSIMLVVAAMAAPNLVSAISNYRLRTATTNLASLLQDARITAVKSNRILETRLGQKNGVNVAWVDINNDGSAGSAPCIGNTSQNCTEPIVQSSNDVTIDYTGPTTALNTTSLLGFALKANSSSFLIGFNQRGLPCEPNPTTGTPTSCPALASDKGYRYYFRVDGRFGTRWGAITITPAGRIRVWSLNGTNWS